MTARKLLSVGAELPGDAFEYVPIDSNQSLLDADLIVFEPDIPADYYDYGNRYQGKSLLNQSGSFTAVEKASHWRSELMTAVEHGKTVLVFLAAPQEAYVYTGDREASGTGRNQRITNVVRPFSSYEYLPLKFGKATPRRGREIVMASNVGPVAPYWAEFRESSAYEVYFDEAPGTPVLLTKTGGKIVGLVVRHGKGHFVLVPPIRWDEDVLTDTDDQGHLSWNRNGIAFGAKIAAALVRLDRELRGDAGRTPPPDWSGEPSFRLSTESALEGELADLTKEIERLQEHRNEVAARLAAEGSMRRLLFASGSELEEGLLESLRVLGYRAENVTSGDSEFDAVFVSPEGERFLGEAEGKENKPLNIDKLSQLERNIQEDFAREEVTEPAKGVLFGNAFRLTRPTERDAFFTEKCLSGARRSGMALVRTPDLFRVAKYVKDSGDLAFGKRCREAISLTAGAVVLFPEPPVAEAMEHRG
jgi:hypothetical protein